MIKVKFYTMLRLIIKKRSVKIEANDINVNDFLILCEKEIKVRFTHKLLKDGKLIDGTIILINGKNIHHIDKEYPQLRTLYTQLLVLNLILRLRIILFCQ